MRIHVDIHALDGGRPVTAAVSNYRPTNPAPVKRFTRAEIRAYIKARGKA
jgi:hypothetical protein